ncbi:MAG: helix-turn-helix transcriptional regulator [Chitinophagaceae bacterium]|nr:helix-turn-helix transcriptional regulator [Chitinophagaceae bacterium]MCA6478630.1 helix-turn-helix transcriptional regulator [Chitinophagaceae bacterium]
MQITEFMLSDIPYTPEELAEVSDYSDIQCFSDEAVYVYSLETHRINYATGWDTLLGYDNKEISMIKLMMITTPDYIDFIREMNNQSLAFIFDKTERVMEYSCTIESKKFSKQGREVALLESVGIYRTRGGRAEQIIGRYKLSPSMPNPHQRYFHANGPGIEELVDKMKGFGAEGRLITRREREILRLLAGGMILKEIANHLGVSKSNIEKKIYGLFKKLKVKNQRELISYALRNQLL